MGGIVEFAKKVISWIGNIIEKVVSWWSNHKIEVNNITYNFIMNNKKIVENADDQENMVKYLGVSKQKSELNARANRLYAQLSWTDQQRIDQLLDQDDY